MIRLILWILILYLGYKLLRSLVSKPSQKKDEVMGKKRSKPLDLSKTDVQDARFEEIDEKKKGKPS